MRILILDPGLKTGVACFENKELVSYWTLKAKGNSWEEKTRNITDQLINVWPYWEPHKTFCEWPTTHFRGNIKSVLKLCFLIGRFVDCWPGSVELLSVQKWKGNLPKEITWRRAEKFFKVKNLTGDAADAVAMGLFLIKNNLI